ncbi:FadR/GntR family transcriptional regulator [Amycolatopsis jiangsuensis]|uniref:DNA-binding FadR family transcriptional regulator n=1 Tax=Amycolatopsis jiangsuensis TaxID=1181879 RepID=A0A840IMZ3_9PSEU|nr:FCD domain-containing protein [Amycolatopsis jiangsuensis]MBB4683320.1 DNA-binding FadR family transcriptional regulator [Amycolatopsis jiangsuensis]
MIEGLARNTEPGTRLGTKTELRETCQVSVGTFNEALRLLQSRGLIEVRPGPGGGLFVAEQAPLVRLGHSVLALDSDETSVADAIRIRDALDPLLFHDAAWHSSPAHIAGYNNEINAMASAMSTGSVPGFMAANWRLHELLAQVNPSPMLRSLYLALLALIRDHTREIQLIEGESASQAMQVRYQVHADLVEAITRQDANAITEAARAHSVTRDVPGARPGPGNTAQHVSPDPRT